MRPISDIKANYRLSIVQTGLAGVRRFGGGVCVGRGAVDAGRD